MKVAPALLLATLFALNSPAPAAASTALVPREPRVFLGSLQLWTLNFDVLRAGGGRPTVPMTSNTLPLLGMGLLVLLGVRILRSRR